MTCERTADILDAYLDGELDPIHARDIDWHIADCPRCRNVLAGRRALQQALQKNLPHYNAPNDLRQSILRTLPKQSPTRTASNPWRTAALAIAACLMISIGLLTWSVITRPATSPSQLAASLPQLVINDHLRSLQTDHLTDVLSTDQHTVKPWFAGKLNFSPPVRDLAADGYPLAGGRLDLLLDQPAAALVYHRNQHIINLFITPTPPGQSSPTDTPPTPLPPSSGYHLINWTNAGMSFWAISDLDPTDLLHFAQLFNQPTITTEPSR